MNSITHSDDTSELAEWVTCTSRRKTPVLPRTRSVTVAGSALQLSYNLALPPHLPSPSNCFWTDGKLAAVTAAWLFPLPPNLLQVIQRELIFLLPASLPALQTSLHRSQLFQQLQNCSGWGLLPPMSQHSSGHSWTKAQRDLAVAALIRVTWQCKCSVTAYPGHSWSGEIKPLLMQAGPDWYPS